MFAVVISRTSQINPKSHHSRVMNKLFKHAFDPFHGKYFAVSFSRETLFLKKFSFAQSSLPLIVRQLNFFELELHDARHIEEQSFQNRFPFHKFCRANTKKSYDVFRDETILENPSLSTWLLQWPGSPPYTTASRRAQ